jgi:hypothetical protein
MLEIMGRKIKDISGNVYGNLTIVNISHSNGKTLYWNCQCECGEFCVASSTDLNRGRTNYCKKCNILKSKNSALKLLYETYKRNASKRNYVFELTIKKVWFFLLFIMVLIE